MKRYYSCVPNIIAFRIFHERGFFYLAFGTPDGNALILPKLNGYPTMLVGGCLLTFFFFFLGERGGVF